MFDRFTDRAKKVMALARQEALRLHHDDIKAEHFLLGFLEEGSGVGAHVLRQMNVNLETVRAAVEDQLKPGTDESSSGSLPFSQRAKRALELAMEEATRLSHNYLGTEHLLLGLLRLNDGIASKALLDQNLDLEVVRKEVLGFLGLDVEVEEEEGSWAGGTPARRKTPALDAFGRDLNEAYRRQELDPVVGREDEIAHVLEVLSRRTKANPVLIGKAGVGKTAIVHGVAAALVEGRVPEALSTFRLVALDVVLLVAGCKYRGVLEDRLLAICKECERPHNVILYVDHIHTIVGAGRIDDGLGVGGILLHALSSAGIRLMGATTPESFEQKIEPDASLARQLSVITVAPPSAEEVRRMLCAVLPRYAAHHRVRYLDEAIDAALSLAASAWAIRPLLDAALDVLDDAGSRARNSLSAPADEAVVLTAEAVAESARRMTAG